MPRADLSHVPQTGVPRWFALVAYPLALLPALAFWWWQGRPVDVADAPSSRVPCVSYAPYQGSQTPFDESLVIPPAQIERDLRSLAEVTGCVRTYSVKQGLEEVPRIADAIGMKVMLGAWIGGERDKNEQELARVIELARRYPETVESVIVGNEVLLRREQPPAELAAMIRRVREAVNVPVTYADVWEFWRKHPEVAEAVDFVTIHILPYWEDEPLAVGDAIPHVEDIWRRMSAEFAGKPVFIGEAGWPSAGRMREGALPSRVNQARFVRELLTMAEREGIGVNLIESFDQPWKRRLEGTVGGHWGLFDGRLATEVPADGTGKQRSRLAPPLRAGGGARAVAVDPGDDGGPPGAGDALAGLGGGCRRGGLPARSGAAARPARQPHHVRLGGVRRPLVERRRGGGPGAASAVARHGRRRHPAAADRRADRRASRPTCSAPTLARRGAGSSPRRGAIRGRGDHPLPRLRSTLPRFRQCIARHSGARLSAAGAGGEAALSEPILGGAIWPRRDCWPAFWRQAGSWSRSTRGWPTIRHWRGRRWP